ncbi:MAG: S8 family peptidase [Pyrinomonadaceae bacterium]
MRKTFWLLVAFVLALAASPAAEVKGARTSGRVAQREQKFRRAGAAPIRGKYIVVLDDTAAGLRGRFSQARQVADLLGAVYGGRVERVFEYALNGYAAEMSEQEALALSEDPRVRFVEEDGVMHAEAVQTNAPWGLDRIDQRNLPLSGTYTYNWTGSGVRAYIIDTGIRTAHTQFGGRATVSFDAIGDGRNGQDCNGHGTHIAGTVGGSTYGVAKGVQLRAVRVLNCAGSGSTSGVIAGVNWVTQNRVLPAVANMSLGGAPSAALDTAVQNSINSGVTYAVSAGGSNSDACTTSPARVAAAITVGATTMTDARASYSSFGTCLDLFAPGSSITSAWSTSNTATATLSGTSMATAHVAGAAALYLQANPGSSQAAVRNALFNNATAGRVTNPGAGSPNRLLYSLFF